MVRTFSLDDPRSDIWRYGAGLGLIGQDATALAPYQVNGEVESSDVARLSQHDSRAADFYPRMVGTVLRAGPEGAEFHVAVCANARVALIVPVYTRGSDLAFEAILPEDSVAPGPNEIELVLVDLRDE
jgi:hypothetical protein